MNAEGFFDGEDELSPADVPQAATGLVYSWLLMGKERGFDDPALEELAAVVRSGLYVPEAAAQLKAALRDLNVHNPKAIRGLTHDLVETMLDLVDWEALIRTMRQREH